MKNTHDISKLGRAPQVRELRDDELQKVSGGHDVRKGGAIIVYDYEGSALRGGTSAQHSAKVTVPDIKLSIS